MPYASADPAIEARFRDIVARAASLHERRNASWFRPDGSATATAAAEAYTGRWRALTASGDPAREARIRELRALTDADIVSSFRSGTLDDDANVPAWVSDLALLFFHPTPSRECDGVPEFRTGEVADDASLSVSQVDSEAPWALQWVFAPLLAAGARVLDADAYSRRWLAPQARRELIAFLARRLGSVCTATFLHRVSVQDTLDGCCGVPGQTVFAACFDGVASGESDEGWRTMLGDYPVLGRLLAVAFRQWIDTTSECLRHLDSDAEALTTMLGWTATVQLTSCAMGAGDLHAEGRGVAILRFSDESRVVYKPKDLRIASAFMTLITTLNAAGLQPPLRPRQVLCRGDHTWEQWITPRACRDASEVDAFYQRMGMLIRLVQLLDGTDFTVDNVLADGPHPELIDLEMLLSPRLPPAEGVTPVMQRALERSWDTPARSGLITAKVRGEAFQPYAEVGALALPGPCRAPFRQAHLVRDAHGTLTTESVYPVFPPHRATPVLDGAPANSVAHRDAIERGYAVMATVLAEALRDAEFRRWFDATLVTVPVRFLCRDTHIYARLLQASLAPARLRDGRDRELQLERLWRAALPSGAVITAEIEALLRLDIPCFTARLRDTAIMSDMGVETPGFFAGDGLRLLHDRIERLTHSDSAASFADLRAVLHTLAPRVDAGGIHDAGHSSTAVPLTRARCAELATTLGDAVLGAAIRDGEAVQWVGLVHDPFSGSVDVAPLGATLADGLSGISEVLSLLAERTRAPRFAEAALAALTSAWALTDAVLRAPPSQFAAGNDFGWPGALAACWRAATRLGAGAVQQAIVARLEALDGLHPAEMERLLRGSHDTGTVATGLAGSVLALAPLRRVAALRSLGSIRMASALGRRLLETGPAFGVRADLAPPACRVSPVVTAALLGQVVAARHEPAMLPPIPADEPCSADELTRLLHVVRSHSAVSADAVSRTRTHFSTITTSDPHVLWRAQAEASLAAYRHSRSQCDAAHAFTALAQVVHGASLAGPAGQNGLVSDRYDVGVRQGLCGDIRLLCAGAVLRPCGPVDQRFPSHFRRLQRVVLR